MLYGYKNSKTYCKCGCLKQSKREKYIEKILIENNINFKSQYIFEDCKYKDVLKFDFAIFNCYDNLLFLCEYDGEQHFRSVGFWGGVDEFENVKKRDNIKNKYCKMHNIELLRLPYTPTNSEIKDKILNAIICND